MENQTEPSLLLPAQLSTIAPQVDSLYHALLWSSVVVSVAVVAAMLFFAWSYRRRPGVKAEPSGENWPLQVGAILGGAAVVLVTFFSGWGGFITAAQAPDDSVAIRVRADAWAWQFEHPNGLTEENEVHVPANVPVRLVMSSADVAHSFFVPDFRVQQVIEPGSFSSVWFEAVERGSDAAASDTVADRVLYSTRATCGEYCGARGDETAWSPNGGHATMSAAIHVQHEQDYRAFVARGPALPCRQPDGTCGIGGECSAEESGGCLFTSKTCSACHQNQADRPQLVGPTLYGAWGHEQPLSDGTTVAVDESYVRQSILQPASQIAQGFPNVMPTIPLTDREVTALVAYIQSLHPSE